jgi:hypothetical protein
MLDYSIRGSLVPSISPRFYGWTGRGGSSSTYIIAMISWLSDEFLYCRSIKFNNWHRWQQKHEDEYIR